MSSNQPNITVNEILKAKAEKEVARVKSLLKAIASYPDKNEDAFTSFFMSLIYGGRFPIVVARGGSTFAKWAIIDIYPSNDITKKLGRWRITHYVDKEIFIIAEVIGETFTPSEATNLEIHNSEYLERRLKFAEEQRRYEEDIEIERQERAERRRGFKTDEDFINSLGDASSDG